MREVTMQLGFGIPHTTFLATEVLFSAQHENQVEVNSSQFLKLSSSDLVIRTFILQIEL